MKDEEDFIVVPGNEKLIASVRPDVALENKYLSGIDNYINSLRQPLWSLNSFIHENPEVAFNERKAHEILTTFMRSQGWKVTMSACGIETAWIATYDSGRQGPVLSFNAEMGMETS